VTPVRVGATVGVCISVGEDARLARYIVPEALEQTALVIEVAAP